MAFEEGAVYGTIMPAGQEKRKLFWGWYVVSGAFLLMAVSYGARYSFGIFVQPLSAEIGTITLTPATAFMLEHFSWKTGFLFIGLTLLVPGILIAQLLLRRTIPEAYGLTPDGDPTAKGNRGLAAGPPADPAATATGSIRGDSRFWVLALCHGTAVMAAMMAFVHQVPYAIDNGISQIAAAASLGAMGFAGLIGQFFYCNFKTESPSLTRASVLPNNLPGQRECLTTVSALCKNQKRLSARSATVSEAGVYIQLHPAKPAG